MTERCRASGPGTLKCELPKGHDGNHGAADPESDDGSFLWWSAG